MTGPGHLPDPGLQQERTSLAWDRTGLALMVASGLLLRVEGAPYPRLAHLLPAVTFLFGLVLVVVDRPRYLRRWRRLAAGGGMLDPAPVVAVGVAATVLGVVALLTVLATLR